MRNGFDTDEFVMRALDSYADSVDHVGANLFSIYLDSFYSQKSSVSSQSKYGLLPLIASKGVKLSPNHVRERKLEKFLKIVVINDDFEFLADCLKEDVPKPLSAIMLPCASKNLILKPILELSKNDCRRLDSEIVKRAFSVKHSFDTTHEFLICLNDLVECLATFMDAFPDQAFEIASLIDSPDSIKAFSDNFVEPYEKTKSLEKAQLAIAQLKLADGSSASSNDPPDSASLISFLSILRADMEASTLKSSLPSFGKNAKKTTKI